MANPDRCCGQYSQCRHCPGWIQPRPLSILSPETVLAAKHFGPSVGPGPANNMEPGLVSSHLGDVYRASE